jgi:hypothetical protein
MSELDTDDRATEEDRLDTSTAADERGRSRHRDPGPWPIAFEALEAACFAVFEGAPFYSASQSLFFATAEGRGLRICSEIPANAR